uniref:CSON015370 protein n=1 Tax=Culicoides sonorensis TaxID=179676 RepID=A0A336LP17_CULSO
MPSSIEELSNVKQKFYKFVRPQGIPNIIGLMDGTHVAINSPGGENAELFRNRKSIFSINVQAVGSYDLTVSDIEARWPGSTHDSYIFDMSFIKMRFQRGEFGNSFLLGDSGYASSSYMLTPLNNPTTPAEIAYQKAHISTRNAVERLSRNSLFYNTYFNLIDVKA